jgi:hypothetical protein
VDDAELERTLRNHLFRDNPNPERVGCPTPEEIRILTYDPQTRNRSIYEHLTVCSQCFGVYERMLKESSAYPSPT